jgi:hypothetical protein
MIDRDEFSGRTALITGGTNYSKALSNELAAKGHSRERGLSGLSIGSIPLGAAGARAGTPRRRR